MLILFSYLGAYYWFAFFGFLQDKESNYPKWFVNPPLSAENLFSVGYSNNYYKNKTSYGVARESAKGQIEVYFSSIYKLKKDIVEVNWGELVDQEASNIETAHQMIELYVIDSTLTQNMALTLVSAYPYSNLKVSPMIKFSNHPPVWINEVPKSKSFIYSMGTAPIYVNESKSWLEAEKNARFELATNVIYEIQSLTKSYNGNKTTVTRIKSEVKMDRVEITARWRNTNDCYVLIRVSESNTEKYTASYE